jgi:hypothetical protein
MELQALWLALWLALGLVVFLIPCWSGDAYVSKRILGSIELGLIDSARRF